ncbi:DGQHR domain-containing protein [Ferruginibacter sp.]|nr:DGQHR domain-containing protein [Ferruginibacter sp.]
MNTNKLVIPCLKGRIGDGDDAWFYYIGLMSFKDIAQRVKLPKEIDQKYSDKDLKLGEWIQRDLAPERTKRIVDYINSQSQRFFNSLILGIFDGKPYWQELNISKVDGILENNEEDEYKYLSETIGILTLDGSESIFAIDGQHRAIGIREAVKINSKIIADEVPVIFVAHKMTIDGNVRTRRLFSTLNRYAKPVNKSEIIALSEDDNCAIITRQLIDNYSLLKGKILINKNRSISIENTDSFTNIMVLYDILERILTNKVVYGIKVKGNNRDSYLTNRISEIDIQKDYKKSVATISEVLTAIPSFNEFLKTGIVNRKLKSTNLIFRPIGQNIFFDVFKIAKEHNKSKEALNYFKKDSFNLANKYWKKVFLDDETDTLSTEKSKQRFASLLILENIGIVINRTAKDRILYANYGIKATDI